MILKMIVFCGKPVALVCDGRCHKAWGLNGRPRYQPDDGPDNNDKYIPDGMLGWAPEDPGTYEGSHGKPNGPEGRLNKWCARECERSCMVDSDDGVVDLAERLRKFGVEL